MSSRYYNQNDVLMQRNAAICNKNLLHVYLQANVYAKHLFCKHTKKVSASDRQTGYYKQKILLETVAKEVGNLKKILYR